MRAMIMAAGAGTRLMPLTKKVPKPMVPVANRPLMENILGVLKAHGFDEIIANLHCQSPLIKGYFHDGRDFDVELIYSEEEKLMGTAGGVRRCAWFFQDTFVVMSGDALTDVNLTDLVAVHKRKGALATIALKPVENVENYGVVIIDEDERIRSFQEKPRPDQALSRVVNTGIYVFEPEVFRHIPEEEFYDFGKQVFPHLVKIGAPFYGHVTEDYWCDVGDIDTYRRAHADVLAGKVKYEPGGQILTGTLGTQVLLGEEIELGKGIVLKGNVVIGPRCRIQDEVVIEDSIIWENTVLQRRSKVSQSVIGAGCLVGEDAIVNPGAVVASGQIVRVGTNIPAGARIC